MAEDTKKHENGHKTIKEAHSEHHEQKKEGFFLRIYDKHYKSLLAVSLGILFLSLLVIGIHIATTGEIITRGISLKGGVSISVDKVADIQEIEKLLESKYPQSDIHVQSISSAGAQTGILIEATDITQEQIISAIEPKMGTLTKEDYIVETTGAALGESFFTEAMIAMLVAFVFMAIVVFLYFRDMVPSFFVVLAAFSDVAGPWAVVILTNTKLSTAGVAAFLMLIGYSVDTDILLTTRVLKNKEGSIFTRTVEAMKTGLTMTLTALAATSIAYLFTTSAALKEMMFILSVGLIFDIIFTWFQNATILRWHLENVEKKGKI